MARMVVERTKTPPRPPFAKGGIAGLPLCKRGIKGDLRLRMRLVINLHQMLHAHLRVLLGRRETRVAQQLLDPPEVRPILQKMRCKAVQEGVRRRPLDDPCLQGSATHYPLNGSLRQFKQSSRVSP